MDLLDVFFNWKKNTNWNLDSPIVYPLDVFSVNTNHFLQVGGGGQVMWQLQPGAVQDARHHVGVQRVNEVQQAEPQQLEAVDSLGGWQWVGVRVAAVRQVWQLLAIW